jgi:flagellar export protein FliJ
MRKVTFRLATLKRLREAVRDERRGQLAEAFRIADAIQERLDGLRQQLDELKRQQAARPGRVDVDRLVAAHRYEMVLRVEQRHNEDQRTAVLAEIERRRDALATADREVRALEKLRETQLQRHRAEEERLLVKELDEIASRNHAREEVA